ncbi:hypothetical protein [Vibrio crassostreae]|uniref:hypothetical protein n=1 Tax=Vibrio crassostreae TaxID=246167 RepID=UPI00104425A1|nr:hypothetical protein [Vibrio crassostreae]TCO00816.1 hypothetical protein EDB51_1085 [Vibrio crassostreae]CAK2006727.1 Outer membrane protein beta-barrel domain-containing protein [Vibrio crassostreae]CAK2008847.1 Outer membrane protein beta-barrel domain-containing protein [Vibrio crassostreae]CAK2018796.1 Outer membrane protein beta-barrel domain-containing protein [Vibrio crassostreae]CAK2801587.1 Outer membrane protein beta-barrel domain-containing protein [Vibrio crassostreae]
MNKCFSVISACFVVVSLATCTPAIAGFYLGGGTVEGDTEFHTGTTYELGYSGKIFGINGFYQEGGYFTDWSAGGELDLGYRFDLAEYFSIKPYAFAGGIYHETKGDNTTAEPQGKYGLGVHTTVFKYGYFDVEFAQITDSSGIDYGDTGSEVQFQDDQTVTVTFGLEF